MKLTQALKGSLIIAATVAAPLFAAHADVGTYPTIEGRCHFDAGDQEQGDDCWAKIRSCIRSDANPSVTPTEECHDFIKVRCGKRTIFAGMFDTDRHDDKVILKGIPNDRFHKPVTLAFEEPDRFPAEVHARLHWKDLDRNGMCFFRYGGGTPPATH